MAVVLSGTAADGAAGVQKVRQAGGKTLAQDPDTAKYKSMPENAIATGAVDFVSAIPQLARRLAVIAGRPDSAALPDEPAPAKVLSAEDPILADLLTLVRSATKADFSHYKQSTVMRRITRRMAHQAGARTSRGTWSLLRNDPGRSRGLVSGSAHPGHQLL